MFAQKLVQERSSFGSLCDSQKIGQDKFAPDKAWSGQCQCRYGLSCPKVMLSRRCQRITNRAQSVQRPGCMSLTDKPMEFDSSRQKMHSERRACICRVSQAGRLISTLLVTGIHGIQRARFSIMQVETSCLPAGRTSCWPTNPRAWVKESFRNYM